MRKTEHGVVISVNGENAEIRVGKHTECSKCGACPGTDAAVVTVNNKIGAEVGQQIKFEVRDSHPLLGAFIVFVLPFAFMFLGVALGGEAGKPFGSHLAVWQLMGGVLFFGLSIVFIKNFDQYLSKKAGLMPEILTIIS